MCNVILDLIVSKTDLLVNHKADSKILKNHVNKDEFTLKKITVLTGIAIVTNSDEKQNWYLLTYIKFVLKESV